MKKLTALRFLFLELITLALTSLFFVSPAFASHKIFQENFDSNAEGSFPSGWVLANGPGTPCNATWKVVNGMAGINIDNESTCSTNIMPSVEKWNNLGNNYVIDADVKFVRGTDHNIAFRFTNSSIADKWYDIHFQTPGSFVLERVPPIPPGAVNITYPTQNREQPYHLKITVNTGIIKMSVDNVEVLNYSYNSTGELEPTGRFALRAGVGADSNSETYFDNIVVANIDSPLNVPLLKQTSGPWQGNIYDTANLWNPASPTIKAWGCAMTSAAMVLTYHGITKLPDGTGLDPGTLNTWLNNQDDGYVGEGLINWLAVSRLSKLAKTINNITAFDALEYRRKAGSDSAQLRTDLDNNQPDILEEPGHFIVAKGIHDTTFDINDPYYSDRTQLTSYNNTFLSLGRYTPSQTNLSYIMLTVDPSVDILFTNASGQKAGSNGTTTYTEIANTSYYTQAGITNPVTGTTSKSLKILMIPTPGDETYTVSIATTSASAKSFSLQTYEYTAAGNATVKIFNSSAKNDEPPDFPKLVS